MNLFQLNHTATILSTLLTFRQPADSELSAWFRNHKKLGRQDRHEIAETVFAAIRHYQKIAAVLDNPAKHSKLAALAALVLGRSANINQLNDITSEEERAFLSALKARKTEFTAQIHTAAELPQWLIERLHQHWNDADILDFGRHCTTAAPLDLRVNTLKNKRDKVLAQMLSENIPAEATPYSPWGIRLHDKAALYRHPLFLDGTLEVQDEGSQLLALCVGAKRGELVVDFCAGAGGKTLALGAQMANKGRIYAYDISEKRLSNLKPRMVRAGLTNIHPERLSNENDPRLSKLFSKADRVLVDAPCSGLGTLRRNPDLKYRQSAETVDKLTEQQQSILSAAAKLVTDGGYLIYATCSVLPEENEQQVERFLSAHPQFHLQAASEILSKNKISLDTGTFLQLNPAKHATDGFFAAILQRKD